MNSKLIIKKQKYNNESVIFDLKMAIFTFSSYTIQFINEQLPRVSTHKQNKCNMNLRAANEIKIKYSR